MRIVLRLMLLLAATVTPALAQIDGGAAAPPDPATLVKASAAPVALAAGGRAEALVRLAIAAHWHINANPPSPDYMIPTLVQLPAAFGVTAGPMKYPQARQLKVEFDPAPLSVYTDSATVRVPLSAASGAENGKHVLRGFVRYQACNDQVCTSPTKVPFTVEVSVSGGAAPGTAAAGPESAAAAAAADSATLAGASAAGGGSGAQPLTPPPGASAITNNPIADALGRGGFGAFLALFLVGLALNLTPCVYPMFGVTVSIFGGRTAAHPLKVFGSALEYVLGLITMYSALGALAAVTGGLFGSLLQNPLVLVGIGVFLIGLSLSMFGLYELQLPPALMQKLGGSGGTGVIGLFVSGLVIGIIAAPCVGPPVSALLLIVASKGDPWFGFRTFFTLALGLGAPYLVLGTFSNLLQKMPRSGDWMIWVKKVFGVVLLAIGLFYLLISFAPHLAPWVAPAAMIAGGLYLGFVEKSAAKRPGFVLLKRVTGIAGLAAGVWLIASAPKQTLAFRPYTEAAVKQALADGQPVILDFAADWCIPCHELERNTFSDARVIAAAGAFAAFKVDLTHSDSPQAAAWTKQYRIQGVPTVVFLAPAGEVEAARFSGFMPATPFLERLKLAAAAARRG